ncbi:hypothetical protein B0H14DRAFT_2564708 [Mycena olivaceomarginata]|nr:hypothetical protein B0H14DRAFT_2564708 [Mycena olivaceomarginata]
MSAVILRRMTALHTGTTHVHNSSRLPPLPPSKFARSPALNVPRPSPLIRHTVCIVVWSIADHQRRLVTATGFVAATAEGILSQAQSILPPRFELQFKAQRLPLTDERRDIAPTLPRPERTAVKKHAQSKFICDTQRTVPCWILNGWRLC